MNGRFAFVAPALCRCGVAPDEIETAHCREPTRPHGRWSRLIFKASKDRAKTVSRSEIGKVSLTNHGLSSQSKFARTHERKFPWRTIPRAHPIGRTVYRRWYRGYSPAGWGTRPRR